jgi:hypothetical protein
LLATGSSAIPNIPSNLLRHFTRLGLQIYFDFAGEI